MNFDLKKAANVQRRLASHLVLKQDVRNITHIAGADFSYQNEKGLIGAIIVVQKYPEFEIVEIAEEVR